MTKTSELPEADIDREMMDNSEMYVQGRFAQMILQEVGSDSRAFYDAAQLRAAFRAGYDYARLATPAPEPQPEVTAAQCCVCGKKGLSMVEGDGGSECQLEDGRWACSRDCYYTAVDWYSFSTPPAVAETAEPVAWPVLEALAESVVQDVCEWDDRTSPEGYEEYIFLTPVEFRNQLMGFARQIEANPVVKETVEAPEKWMLEPAAIYLEMVDDDETGSNLAVAKFLRALATRTLTPPAVAEEAVKAEPRPLVDELTGALRFIMAFYEPGQTHLDTNAWKVAEAGGRAALAKGEAFLSEQAAAAESDARSTTP